MEEGLVWQHALALISSPHLHIPCTFSTTTMERRRLEALGGCPHGRRRMHAHRTGTACSEAVPCREKGCLPATFLHFAFALHSALPACLPGNSLGLLDSDYSELIGSLPPSRSRQ